MALPSQPVAGVDVADRQREKAQADGEHDDVQHFAAPCPMQVECRYAGHMNSRGPRQPRYRNLIKIGREGEERFNRSFMKMPVVPSRIPMRFGTTLTAEIFIVANRDSH